MARLFASEAAIAAAERDLGAVPLFGDAASMGVDQLTFAAYRSAPWPAARRRDQRIDNGSWPTGGASSAH